VSSWPPHIGHAVPNVFLCGLARADRLRLQPMRDSLISFESALPMRWRIRIIINEQVKLLLKAFNITGHHQCISHAPCMERDGRMAKKNKNKNILQVKLLHKAFIKTGHHRCVSHAPTPAHS